MNENREELFLFRSSNSTSELTIRLLEQGDPGAGHFRPGPRLIEKSENWVKTISKKKFFHKIKSIHALFVPMKRNEYFFLKKIQIFDLENFWSRKSENWQFIGPNLEIFTNFL